MSESRSRRRFPWSRPKKKAEETSSTDSASRLSWIPRITPGRGERTYPTAAGFVLILLSMGVGSAAYRTGHNIVYLLLSLLLGVLVVSGLLSWFNIRKLRWRMEPIGRLRAGQPGGIRLFLTNGKRRMTTYAVTFKVKAENAEESGRMPLAGRLEPGDTALLEWRFMPARRGEENIHVEAIETRFPFGFLRKVLPLRHKQTFTVWPERIEYGGLSATATGRWHGGRAIYKKGSGWEMYQIRDYKPGDPPNDVHWRASARMSGLQVVERVDEAATGFVLQVDGTHSAWRDNPEQFEKLCALAASVGEDLFRDSQLDAVQMEKIGMRPIRGSRDLHAFWDALARLEANADSSLPAVSGQTAQRLIRFVPESENRVSAYVGEQRIATA